MLHTVFLGYYDGDEFRVAVAVLLPALLYVTAKRGHSAEAAGHLVLSGSVLLRLAQTVQHDGDGSPGEPALQQRQATAKTSCGVNPDCIRGAKKEREPRVVLASRSCGGGQKNGGNSFINGFPGAARTTLCLPCMN